MAKAKIRSDIGWSTPDTITIRGKSLPDEILGHMNLGDFSYFQLTGRVPTRTARCTVCSGNAP